MVSKIDFTQFSRNKLKIIYRYYYENASELVAKKLIDNIVESTSKLVKYPESGKIENFRSTKYNEFRSVKFKSFKLIYVIHEKSIVVVNVFDMRQNPKRLQKEMMSL